MKIENDHSGPDDRNRDAVESLLVRLGREEAVRSRPVDPGVDAAIRSAIRERARVLRAQAKTVPFFRRNLLAAAAAAVFVAGGIWMLAGTLLFPDPRDLDRDGQVDIVDAYLLARHLEGGKTGPARDLNGDGRIDREDVDALARQAVRVSAEDPSDA